MSVRIKFSEFFGFSDNFGEEEDDDNNKEEEDKDNDNEELYNRITGFSFCTASSVPVVSCNADVLESPWL